MLQSSKEDANLTTILQNLTISQTEIPQGVSTSTSQATLAFELDKPKQPKRVNDSNIGWMVQYSKGLFTSYTCSGKNIKPSEEMLEHNQVPSNWILDINPSLLMQYPKDPALSGVLGILKEILPLLYSHGIDPSTIKETFFPGAGSLQELPLIRSVFPNIKATAVDPLLMLQKDAYDWLYYNKIKPVLGENGVFERKTAGEYPLPKQTDMVVIRHPHPLDDCWPQVFQEIKKNFKGKVLLLTTMVKDEMHGFKPSRRITTFRGFKAYVNQLKEPGDVIYEGTSPSALPLINPEGDPPAGIDLYYMVLVRPPKQDTQAQSSA